MPTTNREEHNNLYCLIYGLFFILSNIRYLNGRDRKNHLQVFSSSAGKAEKLFFRALLEMPEIQ